MIKFKMEPDALPMQKTIEEIAKRVLRVTTLETRNSDSKDFYDCAVWNLKEALEEAYRKGQESR